MFSEKYDTDSLVSEVSWYADYCKSYTKLARVSMMSIVNYYDKVIL